MAPFRDTDALLEKLFIACPSLIKPNCVRPAFLATCTLAKYMTEEIDIKAKVLVDGLQEIGVFMCLSDFHLNILVKEVLRRIGCVSRFAPAFLMRCTHLPT